MSGRRCVAQRLLRLPAGDLLHLDSPPAPAATSSGAPPSILTSPVPNSDFESTTSHHSISNCLRVAGCPRSPHEFVRRRITYFLAADTPVLQPEA